MGDFKNNSIYLWQNTNVPIVDARDKLELAPPPVRNFPVRVVNTPTFRGETSGWGHAPQPPTQRGRGGERGKRGRKNERCNTQPSHWY